ncbi:MULTISPECIES: ABC transporter permease [unclassified Serratia (in: enterobacteria)]|uniref:ABC transporter permease n=1 Tax=unclassified Serratia (in: enterobacteria) TaxID=2647522 RepID=UPI000507EA41|nr:MULTISPECIES: ABC transporter permease [unclassified Serratia (in: enterobacteria)]KFK97626.1 sugar ABC transporter permease [Serratia sp. Ag2]KFK98019.1 sugar ABC transporter permease [Serratia sp. Ag1]
MIGIEQSSPARYASTQSLGKRWDKWLHHPAVLPFIGFVILFVLMSLFNDSFLTVNNLTNVARQVSINAIIAVGMTCAILTGGIDLSVGPVMALSGSIAAGLMLGGIPIPLAMVAALLIGALFGLANGACIAYLRMPPIIVTLASMGIARGLALLYTGGYPISGLPEVFAFFGRGSFLGIQVPILIMAGVYVLAWLMLNHLPFGRYVYAIGGNEEAARLSGIRVSRYKVLVYVVSGVTAALAGLVLTSRLMSGQPNAGEGFELDAIAAVVLGGAAISGGRGAIIGTLVGAMMLGVLNNGLNLMSVSPYIQNVVKGGIILAAIYLSSSRRK